MSIKCKIMTQYNKNVYLLTGVVFEVSLQIERALSGFDDSSESGFWL